MSARSRDDDADLIRISRSVGSLTGNSAGSGRRVLLPHSGDTISVTSTKDLLDHRRVRFFPG